MAEAEEVDEDDVDECRVNGIDYIARINASKFPVEQIFIQISEDVKM